MTLKSLLGTAKRFRRSLPYLAEGANFARNYPIEPADDSQLAPEENPLLHYFDGVTEGPGIWKWRHYFDIYHRHFARFVGREVHVVEVGVYSGGSLRMWRAYFGSQCHVYGVDVEDDCRSYADEYTHIFIGDQADRTFWKQFRNDVPRVDVVIDDGGHQPHQQQVTLEELVPHIHPGGVYLCEDIQGVANPFLGYVAGLAHFLNSHSSEVVPLQARLNSIHLYPFVAVIEKNNHKLDDLKAEKHGTQWQPFSPFSKNTT